MLAIIFRREKSVEKKVIERDWNVIVCHFRHKELENEKSYQLKNIKNYPKEVKSKQSRLRHQSIPVT